jgi:hypothetical protein
MYQRNPNDFDSESDSNVRADEEELLSANDGDDNCDEVSSVSEESIGEEEFSLSEQSAD